MNLHVKSDVKCVKTQPGKINSIPPSLGVLTVEISVEHFTPDLSYCTYSVWLGLGDWTGMPRFIKFGTNVTWTQG